MSATPRQRRGTNSFVIFFLEEEEEEEERDRKNPTFGPRNSSRAGFSSSSSSSSQAASYSYASAALLMQSCGKRTWRPFRLCWRGTSAAAFPRRLFFCRPRHFSRQSRASGDDEGSRASPRERKPQGELGARTAVLLLVSCSSPLLLLSSRLDFFFFSFSSSQSSSKRKLRKMRIPLSFRFFFLCKISLSLSTDVSLHFYIKTKKHKQTRNSAKCKSKKLTLSFFVIQTCGAADASTSNLCAAALPSGVSRLDTAASTSL